MLLNIPDQDCQSESDVEQKFIYPILTHPSFLEIPAKAILSKKSLASMTFVEKATLPRKYIPDYIIFSSGLPICIIEAKEPEASTDTAIKEARIYGQILNQNFPSGINPVRFAVGCNGRTIAISPVDSTEAVVFDVPDLLIGSDAVNKLRDLLGIQRLTEIGVGERRKFLGATFTKPIRKLPSQMFLDRVRPNSLAQYLNPLYEMFFRAEDPEKIQLILDEAYVDTRELREYDNVLHALLRQVERRFDNYQPIQTDRSREYTLTPEIARYESDSDPQGRLHLIIGSRGSGKSLFIARFFSHLLPPRLKDGAVWCVIDFNRAPSVIDNVEDYICDRFVEDAQNLKFNWYELEYLNRIFATDLHRLSKGALSIITDNVERERLISNELFKMSSDRRALAIKLARYLTAETHRPLIVAFDNVDRRESDQQLQIFQAAQWFRKEARAFSLLTLRDVTFERYKSEPPLDAFAQINNFYIRPPRFSLVLQKRLTLAIDHGLAALDEIEQSTSTGLRVRYSKEQLGLFLRNVYDALFVGENQVGRIVDALAERNVREALGMFARILASGHFNADHVIGIGLSGGGKIEHELLVKILMRADYRLYSDDVGFIHNIFWSSPDHFSGNIFLTSEILGFFAQESASGSDRVAGYWRVEELLADMLSMGFEEAEVKESVARLLKWKMLAFDGDANERIQDADLLKITPSGFIHLRTLPYFIEYLSAVAVLCSMRDDVSKRIAEGWEIAARLPDLDFVHKHEVAATFAEYLIREKARLDKQNPIFRSRCREAERIVRASTHAVNLGSSRAARERGVARSKAIERKKATRDAQSKSKGRRPGRRG